MYQQLSMAECTLFSQYNFTVEIDFRVKDPILTLLSPF